ncbi:MAG TPA: lysozyme inhibitor LprI family protein [Allosphingosinicella sp.]|nr:lysozyme inhibitor LprI family protein [Allosphingosinicella sp.]
MVIGAEEALREELVEVLERLRSGRALPTPAARLPAEDSALNAAYRKRLGETSGEHYPGAVTRQGVRDAERAWLRYRDAFLAFAAIKFPRVPRDELAAWLTRKRTALLMQEE